MQKKLSNKENPLLHKTNNSWTSWSRAHEFSPASSSACSDSCISHEFSKCPRKGETGISDLAKCMGNIQNA